MSGITWLHLSDWHQKGLDFDRQVVRDSLIRDIRDRVKIDPTLAQVDFIIFSGDAAFSGKTTEFEAARKYLFDPVLEATGLKADRLFFVPGNHDLSRDTVKEMLPPELQKSLDSDALVQKWLTDAKKRNRILEPFEAYREFVSLFNGQSSPAYASVLRLDANGKSVALLGINSAWMCARNKDAKGEINDYGYMLVGEPQIHDALAQIEDADLRIAVLHYPFDWLAAFDRNRVEAQLGQACHFILRGHEHNPQVRIARGTDGDCVIVPAGATYVRRIVEDLRYTTAYNLVHLDFETGQGVVYFRRWSDRQNAWIEDGDTYPGGKFPLDHLPKDLGTIKTVSTASSSAIPPTIDSRAETQRLQKAEQRYRELLLETCDIINLANLPEQDRHIVQKQQELKLRGLYIPLRVQVEASANKEAMEPEQEEKLWKAMEERRAAGKRNKAGEARVEDQRQRVSVGERLAQSKHLVILGDPGAGKTTLTRWIATAYLLRLKQYEEWKELPDVKTLPDADWLPIIVRCRELEKDPASLNGSLDDILKHTLRKAELSEDESTVRALLETRLKDGRALLMLDGLDEITAPAARASFCQQLEQIAVAYPNAPIIATSRIVGYREMGYKLGRGFEHLTLADLVPAEQDDFARRWCRLTEVPERRETAAQELIHDIHSTPRIERLTGNPMLLTTMALVKRKVGKLPNRRADLYWEAVQVLLNWRPEVGEPLDPDEARLQLQYLAYEMCARGVQQLRRDEIIDLFARMRAEYSNIHLARNHTPNEFLKRLAERTGILVEVGEIRHLGMSTPVYEFRHLTFQEYLAARALVEDCFPGRDPKRHLSQNVAPLAGCTEDQSGESAVVENWREALRLCVVICRPTEVDGVLESILTPLEGEPPATARARAILAALCLADEPNASEQMAKRVFKAFAAHVGEKDGSGRSQTGIDAAAMELAGTRWAQALRAELVSEFCRRKAGVRENPGAVAGMVSAASAPKEVAELDNWRVEQTRRLQEGDEPTAIDTALAIAQLFTPWQFRIELQQARPFVDLGEALLIRLYGNAPMAHAASWALQQLNERMYAPVIWRPTASEIAHFTTIVEGTPSDVGMVAHLVGILGQERVSAAVAPLLARLEDADANVRRAAASALGQIGSEAAVAPLIARLDDADANVRSEVASALGQIGSEAAVAPLIARLDDADATVRRVAASALGRIGSDAAVAPLLARLEDANANVRSAAASALGEIKSDAAVAPLLARLEHANANVQSAAASALGNIKSEAAVAPLLARLDDADANVRSAAASALGRIGSEAAVAPLLARLEDANANVQSAAASALGNIKSEAAVAPLLARLEDADANVRSEAASALGNIKSEAAVAPLLARLEDANANVRYGAADALGRIGSEAAVAPLLARLDDANAIVRSEAAGALGRIGGDAAVAPLIARLKDAYWYVRYRAADALGQIGSDAAVAPLLARLDDADANVRRVAASALGEIKSDASVAPLLARLNDADADVRSAAADALGQIGSEAAVAPLLARLDDADADVRSAAAYALGNIKSDAAVAPLLARLNDADADVRSAAADALGQIKSDAAVAPLLARLDDADATVRRVAASALGQIGSDAAVAPLLARLEDANANVRSAALGALAQGLEEIDRKLLSSDLDGVEPFLDPRNIIREAFVRNAVSNLELTTDQVRERYDTLAKRFNLRLAWQPSHK